MSEVYETDILEWSEQQATLLRRHAAGEKLNDAPDWTNIIEEIESVGWDQLRAVESFLVQAMTHDLKAEAWPWSREVFGWRAEARRFRADAVARFTPAMRQRLALAKLYRRSLQAMPEAIDGRAPLPVPQTCPFTLDELLREAD